MLSDDFLYKDRLYQLSKDDSGKYRTKDGLSRKTKGYQYYCSMRVGQDKVGPIRKPENKYIVHKDFKIGNDQVDSLWVLTSSTDKSGSPLKDRCRERMVHRACPQMSSFDEFVRVRTSCYFLEEKDGVFYCDCWEGMKGKQCKHCIAMMYYTGKWLGEADVRAVPLGKTRKPGRPKKNPHCLLRSPVRVEYSTPPAPNPVADLIESPSPTPPHSPPLRRTTRRHVPTEQPRKRNRVEIEEEENPEQVENVALGNSKPPKKKARQVVEGKGRGRVRGRGRGKGK